MDVTAEPGTLAPLRDGFTVGITNPKSLVFLAALLPQHVVRDASPAPLQMVLLGAIFCLVAVVCDGTGPFPQHALEAGSRRAHTDSGWQRRPGG